MSASALMTVGNTAVTEFIARVVITGQRPVSDIPGFIRQVDSMGLPRAHQIFNTAYETYMRR